jgi:hypothetical protein
VGFVDAFWFLVLHFGKVNQGGVAVLVRSWAGEGDGDIYVVIGRFRMTKVRQGWGSWEDRPGYKPGNTKSKCWLYRE